MQACMCDVLSIICWLVSNGQLMLHNSNYMLHMCVCTYVHTYCTLCMYMYVHILLYVWMGGYICDWICKKGSYTCIQFFDMKDV